MCVRVCTCVYDVEVRRQLPGVGSLLTLCGPQGLNSGHQAWPQEPLLPSRHTDPGVFLVRENNLLKQMVCKGQF